MATTDLHMQILPYDYFTDQPDRTKGLVQLADQITSLQSAPDGLTLVFDNGDFLQGNPLADLIAENGLHNAVHPMIGAFATLHYDAVALGNHEFNYGLGFLDKVLREAPFAVVCANVDWQDSPACASPYVVLDREVICSDGQARAIRIGVLGLVPPQIMQWDHIALHGAMTASDMVQTARDLVLQIRQAGADIIVALCHTGIGAGAYTQGMENAARPLAAIPGIDVVLTGHTHQTFAGNLHGKPAVGAGFSGNHLGLITLTLTHDAEGWHIADHDSRTLPASHDLPQSVAAQKIIADLDQHHARALAKIRQPVAQTRQRLHSYFAPVMPDLPRQILAAAMTRYAKAALPADTLPLVTVVPPFRAGGKAGVCHYIDIPAGPINLRNVSAIYPYTDRPVILHRNGQQLRDWLEQAVSGYCRINPGKTGQPLLDPDFPAYTFDALFGLTYTIDLTQPARHDATGRVVAPGARRITELHHNGRDVAPDSRFAVVVNSYRAFGGGGYIPVPSCDILHQSQRQGRDILADDLRNQTLVDVQPQSIWQFAPIPSATATFRSAPQACAHLQGPVRHIGPCENGFHTYEINFAALALTENPPYMVG